MTTPEGLIVSDRQFKRFEPVVCGYGTSVRVIESSAAFNPSIWIMMDGDAQNTMQMKPGESAAHLSLAQARQIRDELTYMIDNHFDRENEEYYANMNWEDEEEEDEDD